MLLFCVELLIHSSLANGPGIVSRSFSVGIESIAKAVDAFEARGMAVFGGIHGSKPQSWRPEINFSSFDAEGHGKLSQAWGNIELRG